MAWTLALWALLAAPSYLRGGPEAVLVSVPACLLCLVPAALTLLWSLRAAGGSPEGRLLAFVGGMLLRLVVVLGGGVALYLLVPPLKRPVFWAWVVLFYLFTLALETALVTAGLRRRSGVPKA
jgi:hypothetical protein